MKTITNIISSSIFKRLSILLLLLLLFTIISAISYVEAVSNDISNNLFRLHIIANSDMEEDQDLKYLVRDNIISYINKLSAGLNTKEEVIQVANANIDNIKEIAQNTIYDNGYNYAINIEIGNFTFPTKNYDDITLPAGFYDALKIEIGKAAR